MCGRFALKTPAGELIELLGLDDLPEIAPRNNISPTQPILIARANPDSKAREATHVTWGLIPSWAKDPSIGAKMFNARSETAAEKPSFRNAMKRRRCVIPADGFYEWRKDKSAKQPFLIRLKDGRPFVFAGLWERWIGSDGSELDSATILTTSANDLVKPIHDRMPVILDQHDIPEWIHTGERESAGLTRLLRPLDPERMEAVEVPRDFYRNAGG